MKMFTNPHSSETNDDTKKSDVLQYPTASTIPFPYPTVYPQQRDFMDTFLRALQTIEVSNTSSTGTPEIRSSTQPQPSHKQACPVFMFESPTGTGKSLSLACAAIAWLRYMEQVDTAVINSTNSNAVNNATATTVVSEVSSSVDWINDYVPSSERSQQVMKQQMREQVKQARQALSSTLKHIHQQYTAASVTDSKLQQRPNDVQYQRHQHVRKAVQESKSYLDSNPQRKKKQHYHLLRQQQTLTSCKTNDDPEAFRDDNDYLLEQYHSDSENHSKNNFIGNDSWTDDEDPPKLSWNSSSADSVRQLLNGAVLDGSYFSRTRNVRNDRNNASANGNHTRVQMNDPFVGTIGNVKAGSGVRKIIYSARTHSQLSQFIQEIRRTAWGSSIRVVHLGGRKNLCCHPNLKSSPYYSTNERALTEACLDLQKGIQPASGATSAHVNGTKKRGKNSTSIGCPMLERREYTIPTLALHLQSEPTDIEEAYRMGHVSQSCAYYASRTALVAAEVVVLPYSMLLSKTTRDSIGLSLQQALVIVDEAHNVPEALRSIHSCQLSLPIINKALQQLDWYIQRYSDRLLGRNLLYLGQIRKILLAFQKHLSRSPIDQVNHSHHSSSFKDKSGMMTATELLIDRKLDNINLFRVIRFLQTSRLSQKLLGFTNLRHKLEASNASKQKESEPSFTELEESRTYDGLSKHVSAMSIVESFLEKLACSDNDGKITVNWPGTLIPDADTSRMDSQQYPSYRYVLLNPASFFENVLEDAYALALVGGTLRPFIHVAAELLDNGNKTTILRDAVQADLMASNASSCQISNIFISPRLSAFTCDHVVPSSNVLLQCIGRGPTNQVLDFRYQTRSTVEICDELGRTLLEICRTAPNGVVVFLPSYSYEAFLIRHWKKSHIWNELLSIKKIHREPKSSQKTEICLQSYSSDAINGDLGAVLFSVIGGKMSEGINFSDGMARCVVIVGLPYPDSTDPVLIEKMNALDKMVDKTITGQSYYQNLCIRAVNQSVGRAIRHANDYAAIVLIDRRYTNDSRIWSGLPHWLKKGSPSRWHEDLPIAQRIVEMKNFFSSKK